MNFTKLPLSFEEQAQRLLDRGLIADKKTLIHRLSMVNYYRLSGYLYPFRQTESDDYAPGTSLELIWKRYCFDRRLRVLLLDAIERIEVAVRTQLVYCFAHQHGAFGHCTETNLPNISIDKYLDWRCSLQVETKRSKEAFVKHFLKKYGEDHSNLPIWMLAELMSMGTMLTLYNGSVKSLKSSVSKHFGMPDKQLESWLRSLYEARNICAHHSRLWNRILGCAPGLPLENKQPNWHRKTTAGKNELINNRCGILLFICLDFLKKISPTSCWKNRVEDLFSDYPEIPVGEMELPENWQQHPLWNDPF